MKISAHTRVMNRLLNRVANPCRILATPLFRERDRQDGTWTRLVQWACHAYVSSRRLFVRRLFQNRMRSSDWDHQMRPILQTQKSTKKPHRDYWFLKIIIILLMTKANWLLTRTATITIRQVVKTSRKMTPKKLPKRLRSWSMKPPRRKRTRTFFSKPSLSIIFRKDSPRILPRDYSTELSSTFKTIHYTQLLTRLKLQNDFSSI